MNEIIYQHGDVVLVMKALPEGLNKLETNVLQDGESTGHFHGLYDGDFQVFENPKTKQKHLRLVTPTALRHQEHHEIMLPNGDYEIRIVREYNHFDEEVRNVVD